MASCLLRWGVLRSRYYNCLNHGFTNCITLIQKVHSLEWSLMLKWNKMELSCWPDLLTGNPGASRWDWERQETAGHPQTADWRERVQPGRPAVCHHGSDQGAGLRSREKSQVGALGTLGQRHRSRLGGNGHGVSGKRDYFKLYPPFFNYLVLVVLNFLVLSLIPFIYSPSLRAAQRSPSLAARVGFSTRPPPTTTTGWSPTISRTGWRKSRRQTTSKGTDFSSNFTW